MNLLVKNVCFRDSLQWHFITVGSKYLSNKNLLKRHLNEMKLYLLALIYLIWMILQLTPEHSTEENMGFLFFTDF